MSSDKMIILVLALLGLGGGLAFFLLIEDDEVLSEDALLEEVVLEESEARRASAEQGGSNSPASSDGPDRRGRAELRGRLVDRRSGKPIAEADVALLLSSSAAPIATRGDAEGRFEFLGLGLSDRAFASFSAEGYGTEIRGPIRVESGAVIDLGEIELGPGGRLWGQILDAEGGGVARADVSLHQQQERELLELLDSLPGLFENPRPIASVLSNAEGRYEIPGVPAGLYELRVRAPGLADVERRQLWINGRGLDTREDLRMRSAVAFIGAVIDAEGQPLSGVDVIVAPDIGSSEFGGLGLLQRGRTDQRGVFNLKGVGAGAKLVLARLPGGFIHVHRGLSAPSQAAAVVLAPRHRCAGEVRQGERAMAGLRFHLASASGMQTLVCDASGRFDAGRIEAGTYGVLLDDSNWAWAPGSNVLELKGDRDDLRLEVGGGRPRARTRSRRGERCSRRRRERRGSRPLLR